MQLLGLLRRELRSECRQWVDDGDISEEQGNRILARYDTHLDDDADSSLAYKVLVTVSLLFVGLAILLLVSANWEDIPRAVRMLGLIATTITLNLIGIRGHVKQGEGSGWLFLGGISYGASIMLIAQIYHLGEHFPDGLFYWALGVAPMAWLVRSRVLALLMLAVAFLWMGAQGQYTPPWAMVLFLAVAGGIALRARSGGLLLVISAVLVSWLNLLLGWVYGDGWGPDFEAGHLSLNMGLLALLYAFSHRATQSESHYLRRSGSLVGLWALRGYLLLLVMLSFSEFSEGYLHELAGLADPGLWAGLLAALLASAWVVVGRLGSTGPRLLVMLLPFVLLGIHAFGGRGAGPGDFTWLFVVAVNLLALLSAIVLIQEGLKRGLTQYFYSGIVLILLLALMRYLDLFGDYLGAAAMFLVAAAVLYGAARFWRRQQGLETQAAKGGCAGEEQS
ncbi:DUF2157 domain-containing protein [Alcanivorax sp.]|uniref:DUF2157 domain-containing protein n=1 Tax=Alcanivorax sp. TaxID=1872427 RepID=UPI003A943580